MTSVGQWAFVSATMATNTRQPNKYRRKKDRDRLCIYYISSEKQDTQTVFFFVFMYCVFMSGSVFEPIEGYWDTKPQNTFAEWSFRVRTYILNKLIDL